MPLLLCSAILLFFVLLFYLFKQGPSFRTQHELRRDVILNILQQSQKTWCVVLLNTDESQSDLPLFCSEGFYEFMRQQGYKNKKFTLHDISTVFGKNDAHSSFQKGMQHIMHFGGNFSCDILLEDNPYRIEGLFVDGSDLGKNTFLHRNNPWHSEDQSESSADSIDANRFARLKNIFPFNPKMSGIKEDAKTDFKAENVHLLNLFDEQNAILITLEDQAEHYALEETFRLCKEKELSLIALFNHLSVPVWVKNQHGLLTFCNAAYAKLLETHPHHIISRKWDLLNCLEKKPCVWKPFTFKGSQKSEANSETDSETSQEDASVNDSSTTTWNLKNKNVTLAIKETALKTSQSQNDSATFTIGSAIDLTPYKKIWDQDCTILQVYSQIFDRLWLACLILQKDGQVKMINQAFRELFSLKEEAFNEGPYEDLLDILYENRQLPEYTGIDALKLTFEKWLTDTNSPRGDIWYRGDSCVIRIKVISDRFDTITLTFEDITQTLGIEQKYKSLVSVFNETIDGICEAIIILGTDHKIKKCNQAVEHIFETQPGQLLGKSLHQYLEDFSIYQQEEKSCDKIKSLQDSLTSLLELRQAKEVQSPWLHEQNLGLSYHPLSNGWHMLVFSLQKNQTKKTEHPLIGSDKPAPQTLKRVAVS